MAVSHADKKLADPAFYISSDFHPYLTELRHAGPVHWTQPWSDRGFWSVVRHKEVSDALLKTNVFSSQQMGDTLPPDPHMFDSAEIREASGFGMVPSYTDPPRHTLVRKQVSKPFSPQMVGKLSDDCQRICESAVDNVIDRGECDFVRDLVAKIPMHVICALMGVPREDWESLTKYVNGVVAFADPDHQLGATPAETQQIAQQSLFAYLRKLIGARREKPQDDLATLFAQAANDDGPLPETEMCWWAWAIFAAGFETSRNVMSQGVLALVQKPELTAQLRSNPGVIGDAAEEFSRWATPAHSTLRVATEDTVIGDQQVKAGDWVLLWLASANRDATVFANPFEIILTRRPNPHVAFGYGAHNCLGRRIALLEVKLLIQTVLARLDDIEQAGPLEWSTGMVMGLKRFPIRFHRRNA
jgi:cytochrome P450